MLRDNIVHFARVLRTAGVPVGPDRVLAGIAAVEAVGLDRRDDVHAALSAVMLDRHEQQWIFDATFDAFWKDPKLLEKLMALLLPAIQARGEKQQPPRQNRLAEALGCTSHSKRRSGSSAASAGTGVPRSTTRRVSASKSSTPGAWW